jgi:pectinesterase
MNKPASIIVLILLTALRVLCGEKAHLVVAADGSGNYRTIQEALNSIPRNNAKNVIILIRNGTYHEKIFIERSYVTLVGEDRDSTRIIYAELRENWAKAHNGSDWGSGVVNIDSLATDIVLANLTIHNNYGSLIKTSSHQFAIRGNGTRVMLLSCNVITRTATSKDGSITSVRGAGATSPTAGSLDII